MHQRGRYQSTREAQGPGSKDTSAAEPNLVKEAQQPSVCVLTKD